MTEESPKEEKLPIPKKEMSISDGVQITSIEELYRFSQMHVAAGMIPDSYKVMRQVTVKDDQGRETTQQQVDYEATASRVSIGIAKGLEIGLPPVTALSTICVINDRPCLWGDGAVALVQASGKVEYINSYYEGDSETADDYKAVYILKRKDQSEPYKREFSMGDAKKARLLGKKGPWAFGYAKRMLMMRAQAWALRDACSDVLMGIGIAEEVRDYHTVQEKRQETNVSSLDDDFTAIEDKTDEVVIVEGNIGSTSNFEAVVMSENEGDPEPEEGYIPREQQGSLLGDAEDE